MIEFVLFVLWSIGAVIAFALLYAKCSETNYAEGKNQTGMIVIGTTLSWITVFIEMHKIYKEIKEEEKKFKDYNN